MAVIKDAWLVDRQGERFKLNGPSPLRIGRAADNDIVLADPTVSLHHASIVYEDGIPYLHDLASANGSFINDAAVDIAELKDACEIKLGTVSLSFRPGSGLPIGAPRGCRSCGHANDPGAAFCSRCGATLAVSRRWIAVAAAIGGLAALFVLGRAVLSGSSFSAARSAAPGADRATTSPPPPNAPIGNMFAAQNAYPLPGASSDFIGDWCGWDRVTACQPPGSCPDDQAPEGIDFTGGGGQPVTLHAQLMGSGNEAISGISVRSPDPRTVRITYIETINDPVTQTSQVLNIKDDIVAVNSITVNEDEVRLIASDPSNTETRHAEFHKCTPQFEQMSAQWYQQRKLVQRGTLDNKLAQ